MAIPSGDIYLLRDVPLTSSYEHTIDFKNADEQFNYFYGFIKKQISKYTYIRKEREYIAVELPLTDLDDVNYMLFRSADGERLYYAFVTDKAYSNPTSSVIFYSIDVMQTFQFDYKWNASYIRQAHVDRWTPEHKPIYSKTDEGLDYGTEYAVESAYRIEQDNEVRWLLVTLKDYSAILSSGYSTDSSRADIPSTFISALVPFSKKANVASDVYDGYVIANASDVTIIGGGDENRISNYRGFIDAMLHNGLGNYVVSISLLSYNPFVLDTIDTGTADYQVHLNPSATYGLSRIKVFTDETSDATLSLLIIRTAPKELYNGILARADWDIGLTSLPTSAQWDEIKKKPYTTKRDKRFESKLLCAPYRYNLLTDWRTGPVIFKNEYMTPDKIEVNYSFAPTHNAPFRYWIKDYKRDPEGRYTTVSQPIAPEFPVINDEYASYILQNKNTIQTNVTNAMINAGAGVISGAISGGGVGGAGGAIFGAATGAVQGALNVSALIRSENAKQQDLRAVPDGIINNNDSTFSVSDKTDVLTFYRMRICCENEEILGEIFNISGYKVNRVEIPNTRSRTRFNYIQTGGANITGPISQIYLSQIKQIFDTGITLWHYNKEHFNMLDYTYENIEVNLI